MSARIVIKAEREKPIINQHPWIFSGAITEMKGRPVPGDIVDVVSSKGKFLARGYWNPQSQIEVRMLTWRDEPIDRAWWAKMIARAVASRRPLAVSGGAQRLINAENDYLPGLIVDRYGDWLVLQALTLGIEQRKPEIAEILVDLLKPKGIYERSDVDARHKEGLQDTTGVLWGEEPPELISIAVEKRIEFVDVRKGHKTGMYLDQRDNQLMLADFLSEVPNPTSTRLLNLFSYTGGFGISHAGSVTNVDASFEVLELAEKIYNLNGFPESRVEFVQADVFEYLRDTVERQIQYDVVVLDPPKFAHSSQQVDKAARGYKDINLHAFKVIAPGGYLLTFSCSGAITRDLFQKIVFGALADSGRQGQVVRYLSQAEDHPVALTFPEGEYLKGLLVRVF